MLRSKITLSLLTLLVLASCGTPNRNASKEKDNQSTSAPMCGAFTDQRDVTPEELTLFNETMTQPGYTPVSVSTQVVAGINYRFICKGPDGDCVVTIYKPLPGQGEPKVTSISDGNSN